MDWVREDDGVEEERRNEEVDGSSDLDQCVCVDRMEKIQIHLSSLHSDTYDGVAAASGSEVSW